MKNLFIFSGRKLALIGSLTTLTSWAIWADKVFNF